MKIEDILNAREEILADFEKQIKKLSPESTAAAMAVTAEKSAFTRSVDLLVSKMAELKNG